MINSINNTLTSIISQDDLTTISREFKCIKLHHITYTERPDMVGEGAGSSNSAGALPAAL